MTEQTPTEGIVAWLEKAITRREEAARAACEGGEGRWHSGWRPEDELEEGETSGTGVSDECDRTIVYDDGRPLKEQSIHIALNDPASVLRRCAADRKLLALHRSDGVVCTVCAGEETWDEDSYGDISWTRTAVTAPCPTVQVVAEGYGWTPGQDTAP